MPTKQEILDYVGNYSAQQLCSYIKDGIVTIAELCDDTDGQLAASTRREIIDLLSSREDEEWNECQKNPSIEAYQRFICTYPHSLHIDAAKAALQALQVVPPIPTLLNSNYSSVDKNDIPSLIEFVCDNPDDPSLDEALRRISELIDILHSGSPYQLLTSHIKEIELDELIFDKRGAIYKFIDNLLKSKILTKDELLTAIGEDMNLIPSTTIKDLMTNQYIDSYDLEKIGVSQEFIKLLNLYKPNEPFRKVGTFNQVSRKCTEVYFWGIPASGKTCALGGILSVAYSGTIAKSMSPNDCQGFNYMHRLKQIFDTTTNSASVLPPPTDTYATYEMSFDLEDKDGKMHSITCIDLAGETIISMFKKVSNDSLTQGQQDVLNSITSILVDKVTNNRKIHFFVLEYGAHDRLIDGLPQNTYLDGALHYIERTGILKNNTDSIYLLISKADKAHGKGTSVNEELKNYIRNYYRGFYNGLEHICKDNEINDGEVIIQPFSLGKVAFQDYCLFDPKTAGDVVMKLLETPGEGNTWWDKFFKILGK